MGAGGLEGDGPGVGATFARKGRGGCGLELERSVPRSVWSELMVRGLLY